MQNHKLGREVKKTELTWKSPLRRRFAMGEEVEEEEEEVEKEEVEDPWSERSQSFV
jgi:hypothetical protein